MVPLYIVVLVGRIPRPDMRLFLQERAKAVVSVWVQQIEVRCGAVIEGTGV